MSAQHTAEPWRAGSGTGGIGSIVADEPVPGIGGSDAVEYYGGHLIAESMAPRNIRRAIACVNACRGIPTEVLEANAAGGLPWNVADQIERRGVCQELLDALARLVDRDLTYLDDVVVGGITREDVQSARAVVARALITEAAKGDST